MWFFVAWLAALAIVLGLTRLSAEIIIGRHYDGKHEQPREYCIACRRY